MFDIHLSFIHKKNITKVKDKAAEPNAIERTKTILQPESKKRHNTIVHEGKKPFKCLIYNYSASEKQNLNKHIASVHEEKRPFK